ncbi:uncharacterized protein G2W53_014497 [Senna tora]|uniref:Uncharacterized protein n=1 Tax=Senna tora TaxID=362788 RepID=A0A834WTL5_9FABA|nr:uncharacterized protein G2W53_014497 [Senna tora]
MDLMLEWDSWSHGRCANSCKHILFRKSRLNLKRIEDVQVKRVVAQVSQTGRFALILIIPVVLKLEWDS